MRYILLISIGFTIVLNIERTLNHCKDETQDFFCNMLFLESNISGHSQIISTFFSHYDYVKYLEYSFIYLLLLEVELSFSLILLYFNHGYSKLF